MPESCELSDVTIKFLERYYEITKDLIESIVNIKIDDSISKDFAMKITICNKVAIDLSDNILRYTTFVKLQKIAKSIICVRKKLIQNTQSVMIECGNHKNTSEELYAYEAQNRIIIKNMFVNMKSVYADNNIDKNFAHEMISLGNGVAQMCKNTGYFHICDCLKPIINDNFLMQEREIFEIEGLLKNLPRK